MKNIIKTILMASILLGGFFTANAAHAGVRFNDASGDCRTLQVGKTPGTQTRGCWDAPTTVNPGDTVNAWIYYHNTGDTNAVQTAIKLNVSGYGQTRSSFSFSASVSAQNGGYASGSDTINLSSPAKLVVSQAKWYPNRSNTGQSIPNPEAFVDGSSTGGYSIGTIAASANPVTGQNSQGWVIVSFKVVGTTASAACNDGIDNDGDGLTDYPNDPGCTSTADTNEANTSSGAPSVSTNTATNITTSSATLRGTYDANGASTATWFVYSTNPNRVNESSIDRVTPQVARGIDGGSFSASISGLSNNTTYYFRAVAQNSVRTVYASEVQSFQTGDEIIPTEYACNDGRDNDNDGYTDYPNDPGCSSRTDNSEDPFNGNGNNDEPDVTTQSAQDITDESATLRGTVDGNGLDTEVWFIYDEDEDNLDDYRDADFDTSRVDEDNGSFDEDVDNLDPDTRYYYRAMARNSEGIVYGSIRNFTTDDGNGSSDDECDDGEDNDGDGYFDYPNDPGCSSRSDNSEDPFNGNQNGGLSVTTTISTNVTQASARINGLIINQCSGTTRYSSGYFEYGTTTALGGITSRLQVGCGQNSITDTLINLQPNTIYYFRAVAEKNAVTYKGDILVFRTTPIGTLPYVAPTIIRNVVSGTGNGNSLVALTIESKYETARVGDIVDYTVKYRNISGRNLSDALIRIALPKELRFERSTVGEFSDSENMLTVMIGELDPREEREFSFQAEVLKRPSSTNYIVATAVLAYRSPILEAQDEAIAYETITVGDRNSSLGALSFFGSGGFLPDTLIEWLLLALLIFAIVVLARRYAVRKTI